GASNVKKARGAQRHDLVVREQIRHDEQGAQEGELLDREADCRGNREPVADPECSVLWPTHGHSPAPQRRSCLTTVTRRAPASGKGRDTAQPRGRPIRYRTTSRAVPACPRRPGP